MRLFHDDTRRTVALTYLLAVFAVWAAVYGLVLLSVGFGWDLWHLLGAP